jgi:hypothetical protein
LAIKEGIRRKSVRISDLDRRMLLSFGAVVTWGRLERSWRLAAAPFLGQRAIYLVGQEMLHSSEQVGTEATPRTVDALQAVPFEQAGEELVREIAGVVVSRSVASHERFDGSVVIFAQVSQRVSGFRRLTDCRENLGPMCGAKGVR